LLISRKDRSVSLFNCPADQYSVSIHANSGRGSGGARRGVGHREGIVEQLFPLNIH
jgi:hypothetical protein